MSILPSYPSLWPLQLISFILLGSFPFSCHMNIYDSMYLYKAQDLQMREDIYIFNIYECNIIRVLMRVLYFPQELKARGSQVQATIGYMVSSGLA